MKYIYGEFTDKQIANAVKTMHGDIHKLLLYKDKNVTTTIFESEGDFLIFFKNTLFRFGGLSELFGDTLYMVKFMATLQAAYTEVLNTNFNWHIFRRAILDFHDYLTLMFESVGGDINA